MILNKPLFIEHTFRHKADRAAIEIICLICFEVLVLVLASASTIHFCDIHEWWIICTLTKLIFPYGSNLNVARIN